VAIIETGSTAGIAAVMPKLSPDAADRSCRPRLKKAGASKSMAQATAQALVAAEMDGARDHGVSRVALYAQHLREGRANGRAKRKSSGKRAAPAWSMPRAGSRYVPRKLQSGKSSSARKNTALHSAASTNSHHFGAAAYHLAPVAQAGLVGLAFTNSPSAINAWGGKRSFFGTNPIAAIFPRKAAAPIVVDPLAHRSHAGQDHALRKEGRPIPPGWAVDRDGNPTTDAKTALTAGSLAALGGVKARHWR